MDPINYRYFAQDVIQEAINAQHEMISYQNRLCDIYSVCLELIAEGLNDERLLAVVKRIEGCVKNSEKS